MDAFVLAIESVYVRDEVEKLMARNEVLERALQLETGDDLDRMDAAIARGAARLRAES